MRGFILTCWLLLSNLLPGQIQVDKAGDGWDLKIDSAITLIEKTDPAKYQLLVDVCSRVEFWNNTFSSNDGSYNNKGVILVAVKDIKLNSINNLAAVLVHESLHLYVLQKGVVFPPQQEEEYAYGYELDFLNKLPNPEPWLLEHTTAQLNNIRK